MEELISKRTRIEFREAMVAMTLAEIRKEFDAAEIAPDLSYNPEIAGERRSYVEQFYHAINFSLAVDIKRLIEVYEGVMEWFQNKEKENPSGSYFAETLDKLKLRLERDGYAYDNHRILPVTRDLNDIFNNLASEITITRVTRRNISDALVLGGYDWAGRLTAAEFMGRLYPLDKMPSFDSRFDNAQGDIFQHVENNPGDWGSDWIFTDSRFNLFDARDEDFLNFLCETIHPIVRPDPEEVDALLSIYNENLSADGWRIMERSSISGKPVFAASRSLVGYVPMIGSTKRFFDGEYVTRQITRMETSVEKDPESAIGTAKDFLETICKSILEDLGREIPPKIGLSELVKMTRGEMNLLPENIPKEARGSDAIKRVLGSFGAVTNSIVDLRALYGSGHGKNAQHKGLSSRHARLAVGAAVTAGVFLFETYMEQRSKNSTSSE